MDKVEYKGHMGGGVFRINEIVLTTNSFVF